MIIMNLEKTTKRLADFRSLTPAQLMEADKLARANEASIKAHPLVADTSDERDTGEGVWVYLKAGWICRDTETGSIHERTWSKALACLRSAYYDKAQDWTA